MKTKTLKKNKVNVVTLGCSKNLVDSEVLMGQLRANKFNVEHEGTSDDHQIVIINTCGFVDNAKQESIDTILRYVDAKKAGDVETTTVAAEYDPAERALLRKISENAEVQERAALELMPHYICSYLYELAQEFNRFYEQSRVIGDERQAIRMGIITIYRDVLASNLALLGITAPERM